MNDQHDAIEVRAEDLDFIFWPTVDPLQRHFLIRLAQLVTLHHRVDTWPTQDDLARLLVGGAIYSTLRDCEENGVGLVARQIVSCGARNN